MPARVVVLVPGPAGDGSWVDAALAATASLPAHVEIVTGPVDRLPTDADVVLAHGIQYESLVRDSARRVRPGDRPRIVLSDRPASLAGLEHATVLDWAWAEAAYLAGAVAAASTGEASTGEASTGEASTGEAAPVGLLAGPAVRTQRRIAAAFTAGAASVAPHAGAVVVHLPSFTDAAAAERAARLLVSAHGCRVLATTADAAGTAGGRAARELGAATLGFLTADDGDLGYVRSDVTGVLTDVLTSAVDGRELPRLVSAGLASGRLDLVLRSDAPAGLVRVRDEAAATLRAAPGLLE